MRKRSFIIVVKSVEGEEAKRVVLVVKSRFRVDTKDKVGRRAFLDRVEELVERYSHGKGEHEVIISYHQKHKLLEDDFPQFDRRSWKKATWEKLSIGS